MLVTQTDWPKWPRHQGKVRDIYDLGDQLLLVATDRISAFDWVLPSGIPDKGRVLTGISRFWFDFLKEPHHLVSARLADIDPDLVVWREVFAGRTMLVRKTKVVPFECVMRGYLAGSGWMEYRAVGSVCGIGLPAGLVESDRLPEPIFTPATKAATGHDENVSWQVMRDAIGETLATELRARSLRIYQRASHWAAVRGVIIADTKFEFGVAPDGAILLIDEVLTPDSSRFWPADQYRAGGPQPSFDKQFVRDWLESIGFDKSTPPPPLPADIAAKTRAKYVEAFERLTGRAFADYLAQES